MAFKNNLNKFIASLFVLLALHHEHSAQVCLKLERGNRLSFAQSVDSVIVIDKRADTTASLGKAKVDYKKGLEPLIAVQSITKDLADYYQSKSNRPKIKGNKQLVILLYDFWAEEQFSGVPEEKASFKYAADYFLSDSADQYSLLGSVDTTVFVGAYDVTASLFKAIDGVLNTQYRKLSFSPSALTRKLTLEQVMLYHKEERKYIKAYNTDVLTDGAYTCWNDFLALRKTENTIAIKKGNDIKFYEKDKRGKLRCRYTVAYKIVVYNGVPYFQSSRSYCEMIKKGEDYFVTLQLTQRRNNTHAVALGLAFDFGMAMTMAMTTGMFGMVAIGHGRPLTTAIFECRVDSRTGNLMPVRTVSRSYLKAGKAVRE